MRKLRIPCQQLHSNKNPLWLLGNLVGLQEAIVHGHDEMIMIHKVRVKSQQLHTSSCNPMTHQ